MLELAEDIPLAGILENFVNFVGIQAQFWTVGIVFRLIHVVNAHRGVCCRCRWDFYFTNFSYVNVILVFS